MKNKINQHKPTAFITTIATTTAPPATTTATATTPATTPTTATTPATATATTPTATATATATATETETETATTTATATATPPTLPLSILLILLLSFTLQSYAQNQEMEFKFSGFADTYHAVRSDNPNDFMSSRSRLRTEFEVNKGKTYMFASLNAIHNSIVEDETKIELREAFFQYTTNNWDLKAGRQIVIWGIADGLRLADLVSPMDYTEFLARDYDDIRIPVNAFKLKYITTNLSLEALFIPVSSFYIIPTSDDNPWSIISSSSTMHTDINLENYPDKTLDNCEYGGRASFFLSGIDFSISALHTWNKFPILESSYSAAYDTVYIDGQYKRMDMLGMDISFPMGQFVIRGEAAEYFGELQTTDNDEKIERNTTNILVGLDWYPGRDWNITAQYSHKLIPDYVDVLTNKKNTVFATLGITKTTLRNTLKLSSFTYLDVTNSGFFNRTSADYSLTDQIHLVAGYDWFVGNDGSFAMYENNSEYWFKAKYNF